MTLFLSQRIDALADLLIEEIGCSNFMEIKTILVPNGQLKQWLSIYIAKKKGIAMGLKIVQLDELFSQDNPRLERFCSIYSALDANTQTELKDYLDGNKKRLFELTVQLNELFPKYAKHRELLKEEDSWQSSLFQKICPPKEMQITKPVICFGIDFLPPCYWEVLFKAPSLSVYLFSPCSEFWEDLCTDRERKQISKRLKTQGATAKKQKELDHYLRQGPRNLANWGKLSRATLPLFDDFEEAYIPLEPTSALKRVQYDLLTFQETKDLLIDDTIQIFLTGSSRLNEVEILKQEILRLEIPYDEISVLAPDIEPYTPLIEYVFGDEIPYRISSCDVAPQSSFRQGLFRLLKLGSSRWEAEEILSLFETRSFSLKRGWTREVVSKFRQWIDSAEIRWGIDEEHRQKLLGETLKERSYLYEGSWENGLEWLLDTLIYFKPIQVDFDLFEELISALQFLRNLGLNQERSLQSWADYLEGIVESSLKIQDEIDGAVYDQFCANLFEMRTSSLNELYPIEVILHLLLRPCPFQIHGAKLHALRFSSIKEAAMIPAKAVFMIGMDEMSFPKLELPSSIDLLRGKIPKQTDLDRYSFLQAIFSATESLRISYGHLSADEGKPVNPSLLVQELLFSTGTQAIHTRMYPRRRGKEKHFLFPNFDMTPLPEGEMVLSIGELKGLARHPWRFFLQKVHKLFVDEDLQDTFALQRGKMVRSLFEGDGILKGDLPAPIKEALQTEALEKVQKRNAQLSTWGIEKLSIVLKEQCKEMIQEGDHLIVPALELKWENLRIKLVGEIQLASRQGLISVYEDNIAGTIKIWPEALVVALIFGVSEIWNLRSSKSRSIQNPKEALQAFVEYYFQATKAPSPLLPEWVDLILRKGCTDKIGKNSQFEDPVMDWVFARAQPFCVEEMAGRWIPFLKDQLKELINLYPLRSRHAEI